MKILIRHYLKPFSFRLFVKGILSRADAKAPILKCYCFRLISLNPSWANKHRLWWVNSSADVLIPSLPGRHSRRSHQGIPLKLPIKTLTPTLHPFITCLPHYHRQAWHEFIIFGAQRPNIDHNFQDAALSGIL